MKDILEGLKKIMQDAKLKTGFSKLNDALGGGFKLGDLWAIVGDHTSFRTGFAYTLARDIVLLNPQDTKEHNNRVMLARGNCSNMEVLDKIFSIVNKTVDPNERRGIPDFIKSADKNGWTMQTRTPYMVSRPEFLEQEIAEVEEVSGEAVKVVVFDHLADFQVEHNNAITSRFNDIRKYCKKRNMLAIIPTRADPAGRPIRTENLDGVMYVSFIRDEVFPHHPKELAVHVVNKRSGVTADITIPFYQMIDYGLIADVVPDPQDKHETS